ncbi:VOC family protein [Niveispirillum sp. KHB5.9]|uniref:VOC family protein n=1 Tax=Niveispirillum sp. KHB5.9 TaxID=3400269 RepID=UPI003A862B3F
MPIAHIALWTRDLEAAAHFWRLHFDADVGEPYHSNRRPGFVSRFARLPCGGQIELMTAPWLEERRLHTDMVGWDHIAICVGDREAVDRLAARCRTDGLLLSGPRVTGDGFYEAVVATPDGTCVEITGTPVA